MYNNNNCDTAALGGVGLLVILIFFAMFSGNGNGFWGNGSANTAAETASLVQQDNLRSQVSGISSRQEWQGQLLGGAVQGIERTRDAVAELDTKICQAVNNLTQQNNGLQNQIASSFCDLRHQLDTQFCQTNQNIINSQNLILNTIQQNKFEAVKAENADLKTALATQAASCAREADTRAILSAIGSNRCCNTLPPVNPDTAIVTALQNLNTTQQAILAKLSTTSTATA